MSSSSEDAPLPLGDLLRRAAAELRSQAEAVEALHALAEGLGEGTGPDGTGRRRSALRAGQSIDVVAQHLLALAGVIEGAAEAAPDGAAVPSRAVGAVTLSDLAARLRGEAAGPAEDGEFELL